MLLSKVSLCSEHTKSYYLTTYTFYYLDLMQIQFDNTKLSTKHLIQKHPFSVNDTKCRV